MQITDAIKVAVPAIPAKAVAVIRKETGLPIPEIRWRASNDELLFVCDHVDDNGLKLINRIRREMKKFGISLRQLEDGVERSPELLDNLERLHDEINAEYSGNRD